MKKRNTGTQTEQWRRYCEQALLPELLDEARDAAQAPPHTFSPEFEARMAGLLAQKATPHRSIRICRLRACRTAVAMFTMLITGVSLYAVSASPPRNYAPHIYLVDDPVNGEDAQYLRFMDWPESVKDYTIDDNIDYTVAEQRKVPHDIPAAFSEKEIVFWNQNQTAIDYRNAKNETISFTQDLLNAQFGSEFGRFELTYMTFHGYDALYAHQDTPTSYSRFYWTDNRYAYSVCGNLTKEELIELAESVY